MHARIFTLLFIFFCSSTVNAQTVVYYADAAKIDNSGDGLSWATAKRDLQPAIDAANAATATTKQVWVKKGSYKPIPGSNFFEMRSNVGIFGGFSGTETSLTQRNWITNTTTLTNVVASVPVFFAFGSNIANSSALNGFTLANTANGNSGIQITNGASPIIANCRITGNFANNTGGGIDMYNSNAVIINCIFDNNTASADGGAININNSSNPIITNCVFTNNIATNGWGGAINSNGSSNPTVTNCTFFANSAPKSNVGSGGAICSQGNSNVGVVNSIIWGNSSGDAGANLFGTFAVAYSLIEGGYSGTVTIASNPNFVNSANPIGPDGVWATADDGLRLSLCSPAINLGNNSYNNITSDIGGYPRIQFTNVDLGAYENNAASTSPGGIAIDNTSCISSQPTSNILNYFDACNSLITTVSSVGVSPITGSTTAKVWLEATQPTQYVKRHYEITPDNNASTATGMITLYFTQAEFDAFNAVNSVKLPMGPTDATGIANLKIEKRSGVSSDGTGLPNTYPAGTPTTIDPDDGNIVWNSALSRWEVSFDVTGFSGFFAKTTSGALPAVFGDLTATITNGQLIVHWNTLTENNVAKYIIEVSKDGSNFTQVGTVLTKATDGQSTQNIQYEFSIATNNVMGLMGISLAFLLLLPSVGRRKILFKVVAMMALFTITIASCSKKDVVNTAGKNTTLYVRVVQVDKAGNQQVSKVTTATVK